MTNSPTIRIACAGSNSAPLAAFNELQGDLKTLPEANYQALRTEILEQGFSFPPNVWEDSEGKLWLVDGHQRIRTLNRMVAQGAQVGEIPYSVVFADSIQEAKHKLLGAASQYGETNEKGLTAFLQDLDIEPIQLQNFPLPKIDMPVFISKLMQTGGVVVEGSTPDVEVAAHSRSAAETEWQGMPEFQQENKKAFRHVIVHFPDENAVAEFFAAIGQKYTENTKTVWFPPQENMDTASKEYAVE